MKMTRVSIAAAASLALFANVAYSDVILTDIFHASDQGGVWSDSNLGNWAIWIAPGTDPTSVVAGDVLNPGNPVNNTNVSIPNGTSSYVLFKEVCCAANDNSTKFTFSRAGYSGTVDVTPSPVAYQSSNVAPAANGATLTLGPSRSVTVNNFNWYHNNVYNKDLVGQSQNFAPSGSADHVGRLTVTSELHAVAHYTFDDANDLVHDSSGNNLHGINNGGTAGAAQVGAGALALSGGGGNANLISGDVGPIVQAGSYAVSVWFKNTGSGGVILDELGSTTTNTGWHDSQIELQTDGSLKMSVWARDAILTSPTGFGTGWHNAIVSYDTSNSTVTGYVDGQSIGSAVFARQNPFNGAAGHAYYAFGPTDSTQFGNGVAFTGLVDDAQIFGTALSAAEAQAIYSSVVPEPGSMMILGLATFPLMSRRRNRGS